jgi:hypothetical protein
LPYSLKPPDLSGGFFYCLYPLLVLFGEEKW